MLTVSPWECVSQFADDSEQDAEGWGGSSATQLGVVCHVMWHDFHVQSCKQINVIKQFWSVDFWVQQNRMKTLFLAVAGWTLLVLYKGSG